MDIVKQNNCNCSGSVIRREVKWLQLFRILPMGKPVLQRKSKGSVVFISWGKRFLIKTDTKKGIGCFLSPFVENKFCATSFSF